MRENGEHYADEIIPGLFLGSICAVRSGAYDDKAIISIMRQHDLDKMEPRKHHLRIALADESEAPIENHFNRSNRFIEAHIHSVGVLVHCHAGHSRSVTLVMNYLMTIHTMTFDEAMALVKQRRPTANPNPGFVAKLKNR
jgi:protein-tyrosine phosphatase